jgi:uncharacterized protein YunC (DUF1805 family)
MIECSDIKLRNGVVHAVRIQLKNAPLILINSSNGYVMCGYLSMDIANKMGDIAAKVTGVKTIQDALDAKIVDLSIEAQKFNVELGMSSRKFLNVIMKE